MPFLTAEWRHLAMLNYQVDPAVLARDVPAGTELDSHEGKTFVSLVGFRFLNTRLLGLTIPLHSNFDEVNLRFYVRRKEPGGVKRGTVFLREIVPRRAIAKVARMAYNEKYIALPMSHRIELAGLGSNPALVEYGWKLGPAWNHVRVQCAGLDPVALRDGSHEQFIERSRVWASNRIEWRCGMDPTSSLSPSTIGDIRCSATAARWSTGWSIRRGGSGRVSRPTLRWISGRCMGSGSGPRCRLRR